MPLLSHLQECNVVWDSIIKRLFGKNAIENLDMFGRYLVLRQQRIFKTFDGEKNSSAFKNIYKDRCKKFYEHSFYDYLVGSSELILNTSGPTAADDDYAGKKLDQELRRQKREKCFYDDSIGVHFAKTLKWVQKI